MCIGQEYVCFLCRWRVDESSKGSDTPVNDASQLQSQAAKELIAESEQYMQKQQSNANSEVRF